MVRVDRGVNVVDVDASRHAHEHVLGAFNHAAIDTQQVGALERLAAQHVARCA